MSDIIFGSVLTDTLTPLTFFACTAAALVLGFAIAAVVRAKGSASTGFLVTLALLPFTVQVIIMLVNGSVGAGIAVMGAFSLVRFRSVPGTAREITSIFLAMAVGLACGGGYIGVAVIFTVIALAVLLVCSAVRFGEPKKQTRRLKVSIPESLDYTEVFDDIFASYLDSAELQSVKTTNMGSLFQLAYDVELKQSANEKAFIDALRCRNGNLDIVMSRPVYGKDEL